MFRTLFTFAAAASAILCAGALVTWACTAAGRHRLTGEVQRADGRWEFAADRGGLRLDDRPHVQWEQDDRRRVVRMLEADEASSFARIMEERTVAKDYNEVSRA